MADLTAVVTGAGSPTGFALVRSLMERGITVFAADPAPDAPGRMIADVELPCPWATDKPATEQFWDSIQMLAPDIVVSTVTRDMRGAIDRGLPVWTPTWDAIQACEDKMLFAERMAGRGLRHPVTDVEVLTDGPWVVKPRWGEGSRDTFVLTDRTIAETLAGRWPDMIVQQKLDGDEFEVDVVAEDGAIIGGVAFWIRRRRGGTTMSAETFNYAQVAGPVAEVVLEFGLSGPLNIGGFVKDGRAEVLEVNPRFSHGYLIGEAAGIDLLGAYVHRVTAGELREVGWGRPGVRYVRHYSGLTA